MSDKTFGVKVSEELHDKVKSIIENSGISSKEWFEKMVAISELQSIKQGAADYSQDLNELEIHTARIYELISNMVQRSIYIKENAVQEIADKLQQREAIIGEYQEKASNASAELKQAQESLKALEQEKEELVKQLESQQATVKNNQSLIHEYKEKIDTLSSLVNKYQGYAAENETLKSTIEELKGKVYDQQDELSKRDTDIALLKDSYKNQLSRKDREIQSLKVNQENQLTQLTGQKDLEKERAILEIRQEYQEKLQAVHDQYNAKLAEYNEKVTGLYEKLEQANSKKSGNQSKK